MKIDILERINALMSKTPTKLLVRSQNAYGTVSYDILKRTTTVMRQNPVILFMMFLCTFIPMGITQIVREYIAGNSDLLSLSMVEGLQSEMTVVLYGIWIVVSLLTIVLGYTPIFTYIYRVCADKETTGWYRYGLQSSWWKLIVIGMIYAIITVALIYAKSGIFSLLSIGNAFGIRLALTIIIATTLAIYSIITMCAVVAEKRFGRGLVGGIKVGSRFFFKELLAMLIVWMATMLVIAIAALIAGRFSRVAYGTYAFSLILGIWSVLASTFVLIYTMTCYLHNCKSEVVEEIAVDTATAGVDSE